uniref:Uncharacterized protein n=1 Tax=viral metagenome TaxID=1070528 RepID=A0A6C0CIS8_9ZZZZ
MSLSVDFKIGYDEKDVIAVFTIKIGSKTLVTMTIYNAQVFNHDDYSDFIEHRREELEFCELDGRVCLSWQPDGQIKCEVSKIGAGGDGEMCLYLGMDLLKEPLIKLAALVK